MTSKFPVLNDAQALNARLSKTRALLLDFDGPICSVFAGFPAQIVADQLREVLADGGYRELPVEVVDSEDPFDVLTFAESLGQNEVRYVEAALRAHEIEAVSSAVPTDGAHEAIYRWNQTGRPLAIVSNNSSTAVSAYLQKHQLTQFVSNISARSEASIALLKPAPYLLTQATSALNVEPSDAAIVGDSITDIEAAFNADVHSIGYANKPGKFESLLRSGAEIIVDKIDVISKSIAQLNRFS